MPHLARRSWAPQCLWITVQTCARRKHCSERSDTNAAGVFGVFSDKHRATWAAPASVSSRPALSCARMHTDTSIHKNLSPCATSRAISTSLVSRLLAWSWRRAGEDRPSCCDTATFAAQTHSQGDADAARTAHAQSLNPRRTRLVSVTRLCDDLIDVHSSIQRGR